VAAAHRQPQCESLITALEHGEPPSHALLLDERAGMIAQ
jgi:hypothetical protein